VYENIVIIEGWLIYFSKLISKAIHSSYTIVDIH